MANGVGEGLLFHKVRKALEWWCLSGDLNSMQGELCSCQGDFSWQRVSRYKGLWWVVNVCMEKQGTSEGRRWTGAEVSELGVEPWGVLECLPGHGKASGFSSKWMGSSGIVTCTVLCFHNMPSFTNFLCSFCVTLGMSHFVPEPVNFLLDTHDAATVPSPHSLCINV